MSKKSLSITFVLPGAGTAPAGGYKVVYEYANGLVRRGHRVAIVHPAILPIGEFTALQYGKGAIRYIQRTIDKSYRPTDWFQVDPRVQLLWKPALHARHIPDGDIIVATAWPTAEWVAKYPATKGNKFYLLQSQETWGGPEDRVMATWRLPLHKIVIAQWLRSIAEEMGEHSTYIPNGMDFNAFGVDVDPQKRDSHRMMMLYHGESWKGSADGLTAMQLAKKQIPGLEADIFGVPPAPEGLPQWIRYHQKPPQTTLRQLYNSAAIFLSPSLIEGWPLPPAEAMMSGCAVAATDIGGHREYCIHEQTALLSPPQDPDTMAENLLSLLQDHEKRTRLAGTGNEYIQQFTWERAVNTMENAFAACAPRLNRQ